MSRTEKALKTALPGLMWTVDGGEWEALVFGRSYAELAPVGHVYRVRVLGNAETCYTLAEAVAWLRAQIETVHARLGVAMEGK